MASTTVKPVYGEPRHAWLDWLRAISILLVLGYHYQVDWWDAGLFQPVAMANMRFGWSGVDFFFAISGFLIGNLLLSEVDKYGRLDTRRFYIRRAAKIWPLYYGTCLLYILLSPIYLSQSAATATRELVPSLIHLQNYLGAAPHMAHFWSLAVEEHFYLLLPILVTALATRWRGKDLGLRLGLTCAALIGAVFLIRFSYVVVTDAPAQSVRFYSHFRIDALLCGVLLASIYRFRPELWTKLARKWQVLTVMSLVGLATFAFNPNTSFYVGAIGYTTVQLLFCAIIIATSRADVSRLPDRLQRGLAGLAWIGRHSYPIYLLHPFLWIAESRVILPLVAEGSFVERSIIWLVGYVVFVAASIALGALVGELLEKPLLALRNRLYPPRTQALADSSGQIALTGHSQQPGGSAIAAGLKQQDVATTT